MDEHESQPSTSGTHRSTMASLQDQDHTHQTNINSFYELISNLSKIIVNLELSHLVILCRGKGVPKTRMSPEDAGEFLMTLNEYDIIGEDKTSFLKEILEQSGCNVGKTLVEKYEADRREHLRNVGILLGRRDPLFVGRESFIRMILQVFQDASSPGCRCVLVYGLAGTGKTKLAAETCAIYEKQVHVGTRLIPVNLRKATKVQEVGLWIHNAVTGKPISSKQFDMMLLKSWILKCPQDTILVLDNADDILRPSSFSRDHFVNTLTDLLSLNNRLVKILITSRHPVDSRALKDTANFLELKLEPLSVNESLFLIRKLVNRARELSGEAMIGIEDLVDKDSLIEIAQLCGNNPQALRTIASWLSNRFNPKSLVEALKTPETAHRVLDPGSLGACAALQDEGRDFEDQPLVLRSLSAMCEQLPSNLKEALLRLSVFPGSFSQSQAAAIFGKDSPTDTRFDLEGLKRWSFIERIDSSMPAVDLTEDEPYYNVHPLVRSIALGMIGTSSLYKVIYEDSLRRYMGYIANFLGNLVEGQFKDFGRALASLDTEKTNVLHFLELHMGHKFGCQVTAQDDGENGASPFQLPGNRDDIFHIFETFLDPSKRRELYEGLSHKMQSRGEPEGWAYMQAWLADEEFDRAKYEESLKIVEGALKVLQLREADSETRTRDLERAEVQLFYVKGRLLVAAQKYKEGIAILEKALTTYQRILGDHSLTARCLNAIGHCYYNMADDSSVYSGVDKAHDYHLQAWKVLEKITRNEPEKHMDAAMYLMNIGSTYHLMGNKHRKSDKKKAEAYFHLAIENYKQAHDLERALRISNTPNTAFILKNMAMSHCEMESYEEALHLAIEAFSIREETMGDHPTTARNIFFIGCLYNSLGDKYAKSKKLEDNERSNNHFSDALKYYQKAFEMEVRLGSSHSIEYEDLMDSMKALLKKLHMDKELETYKRIFKMAGKGTVDISDVSKMLSEASSHPSQSSAGSQDTGQDDATDQTAGPSRRRKPGPVLFDESGFSQSKRKCTLS